MDFFARQAATRRLSRWMVLLFILAVVAIVVAIDLVVIVAVAILTSRKTAACSPPRRVVRPLPARRYW